MGFVAELHFKNKSNIFIFKIKVSEYQVVLTPTYQVL